MNTVTIYHNPRCSKSRQTLDLIKKQGITPNIIDYIKQPLDYAAILKLSKHFDIKDFVRSNEKVFKELGLSLKEEDKVLRAMVHEPKLMQRPIVIVGDKAAMGRPPENVLALLC